MGNLAKSDSEKEGYDLLHPPNIYEYKYFNRDKEDGIEEFEETEEEKILIESQQPEIVEIDNNDKNNKLYQKVIIDTNLGTDWDSTLALLYSLYLNNIEILGITTNYGIPELRAKLIKKFINLYYRTYKIKIPVITGASRQLGASRPIFLFGNEGLPFFNNISILKELKSSQTARQDRAARFIIEKVLKFKNQVKIISIGIPTNIGLAIKLDSQIKFYIEEIVISGFESFSNMNPYNEIIVNKKKERIKLNPNHNLASDPMATKIIFESGIRIKVIPYSIANKFKIDEEMICFFNEKASTVKNVFQLEDCSQICGLLMREWFNRKRQIDGCLYDSLVVYETIFKENSCIDYIPGKMIIHEWAAFGTFIPMKNGIHFLGININKNKENFENDLKEVIYEKDLGNISLTELKNYKNRF